MKKKIIFSILVLIIAISGYLFFTLETSYRSGVNFKVTEKKIPLYIKTFEFISREYHYRRIIQEICPHNMSRSEKIDRIFQYIQAWVKPQPDNLPVFDDHPYNILIRGYGEDDQFEDIFTILCFFADIPAFYQRTELLYNNTRIRNLSFVQLAPSQWTIINVRYNIRFKNGENYLTIDQVKNAAPEFDSIRLPENISAAMARVKAQSLLKRFNAFFE